MSESKAGIVPLRLRYIPLDEQSYMTIVMYQWVLRTGHFCVEYQYKKNSLILYIKSKALNCWKPTSMFYLPDEGALHWPHLYFTMRYL